MEQSDIASIGVQELCRLFKDDENLWMKSPVHGRDVLVQHNYERAFCVSNKMRTRSHYAWIEASRSFAYVKKDHWDLAISLIEDNWTYLFPNMVAKEETIAVLSPGSSEDNPDGSLKLMYKELQVTSPIVAKRKFTCLRTCKQIDQGTWVVAEISYEPILNLNGNYHSNYRRLPSGCLIQSISEELSKVTWVEHMEVEEIMPNHTLYDQLIRSGLAFGAERMLACLERWHERMSHMNDICHIRTPGLEGKVAPWIMEKFSLMEFGESMVSGLFENISPNEDKNSSLWRSITGLDDLKVYATLYKSSSNYEAVGGAVTFGVKYSPEFVLKILGDERNHEWDVVGGLRKLNMVTQYSTAGDPRNNVSASMIEGSSDRILIKEVNVNHSGSLVVWTTVSKKVFDLISLGKAPPPDVPVLISGFSINTDGHTTDTNRGGSVVTLVLRMWGVGNKPLQEKGPESVALITLAINQTVGRVKEALEKQRPSSPPRGVWPTEEQQVGGDDMETEILQNELRLLKMN